MTANENIRINKVLKEFNIGMGTLVDFLHKKGVSIEANPNAKIVIQGYASPEGALDFNQKLSQDRANPIKRMLVDQFKISADRITAEGKGIGEVFPQPAWNRLGVCVINTVQ